MSAIISEKFRIFNAKQFLESIGDEDANGNITNDRNKLYFFVGRPQRWDAYLEVYSKGAVAFTVGREVYVKTGPSGTNYTYLNTTFRATVEAVYDNSVLLSSVFPSVTSAPLAGSTIQEWDGAADVTGATAVTATYRYATEDAPPVPLDNQEEKQDIYDDIIAAKRVTASFVRPVIPRGGADWNVITNRLFDMYRPDYAATPYASNGVTPSGGIGKSGATGATSLSTAKHYVMNRNYEVFKCLYNGEDPDNANGQNATYEPKTTPSAGEGTYTDGIYSEPAGTGGYRWKYLYTIPTNDVLRFLSSDFIPVCPYAGTAVAPGVIDTVVITDRGSGLPNGTHYAPIKGDGGTEGLVEIIVTAGEITGVRVPTDLVSTAGGAGYTYASIPLVTGTGGTGLYSDTSLTSSVTVNPGSTGKLEVIIPPAGGHGADLEAELVAKRIMANIRLTYAEGSGDFPVDNDFRRIGLIKDPQKTGTGSIATDETLNGLYAVKIANTGGVDYVPDEMITQATVGGKTAIGTVVSWTLDSGSTTAGVLKYIQSPSMHTHTDGVVYAFESNANNPITGGQSLVSGTVDTGNNSVDVLGVTFQNGLAYPEIANNSGDLIYIENRRLITRAADQIEDIKLVIEF